MSKLTILRGISGSGKSTWAREQNAVVVSRDAIRASFFPNFTDKEYYTAPNLRDMEDSVTHIQDAAIAQSLKAGKDVIVDNTNIEWKYVKALAKIGYAEGAEVEVKVFDVPLGDAVDRVAVRHAAGGRHVDYAIIRKQHDRFQGTKDRTLDEPVVVKPYHGTPGKPKAFLVDIDGTLAHMNGRSPFDWKRVGEDELDEIVSDVVWDIWAGSEGRGFTYKVLVMSGRDESCRAETAKWLDHHAIPWNYLYMRKENDMRADNIVKAELFDEYVRNKYDVKFVLDDRDQVVRMWRQMGLTCLQVAEGAF